MRATIRAIAILVGTTIGAGMFAIPYVMVKIGFWPGAFYLLGLGALVLLLNLAYGEVILRTSGDHQMVGYAQIYFGDNVSIFRVVGIISFFISLYGALLVYLIKIGEFMVLIFGFGNPVFYSTFFFFAASAAVFFGLRTVSSSEALLAILLFALIIFISFLGLKKIDLANFSGTNLSFVLFPYGVILFALTGNAIIPEMEEVLREEPQKLKKTIIIGSLIPVFVYLLFAFLIVGISGSKTSPDAISGLAVFLPDYVVKIGAALGIITMTGAFLSSAYALKETWFRDFRFSPLPSFALSCFPSFLLFLLGVRNFITILEIAGAISGGLAGILILEMFKRAKIKGERKPAFELKLSRPLVFLLYLIFIIGMVSPFFTNIKF